MRKDIDEKLILDLNQRFHDDVESATYDQRMGVEHDAAAVGKMVAELESVLGSPLPRGGRAIDLGSGTGNVAIKLALTGWFSEVLAVDISRKSLEMAERNARALGARLSTQQSDLKRLPFDDASVEFVVGCAFLHHLPDPVALLGEIRRVLKPGGRFVILGEPTAFGMAAINCLKFPLVLLNRALRSMRKQKGGVFRWDHDNIDVHDFTQADARRLVAGFEHVRIITEGFAQPIVDQALLTPVRFLAGENRLIAGFCRLVGAALGGADRLALNRLVPRGMRVSLKLSGRKPGRA